MHSYDNANRLINLTQASNISGTINSFAYSLDNVGNRTAMTDTNGTTSYSYDAAYRLQSAGPITFTWDADGNMKMRVTPRGTVSYTYDYANRLTQVLTGTDTFQYYYDGDGTRLRKSVNGSVTDYLWDVASGLPAVISDTNDVYLYGLDLISRQDVPSGTLQYYHSDALGSVRNLTDASGAIIGSASYDAFGAVRSGTVSGGFQFAGQESDPETGLYYLRARYYDPGIGRFTTRDTWSGDTGSPYSLNPYLYVQDDPANLVDATGHCSLEYGGYDCDPEAYGLFLDVEPLGPMYSASGPDEGAAAGVTDTGAECESAAVSSEDQKGLIRLFRSISDAELADLSKSNLLRPGPGSLEGKWFAESANDASRWGEVLEGNTRVIAVNFPTEVGDALFRLERLDNIGPARYANLEQLRSIMKWVLLK